MRLLGVREGSKGRPSTQRDKRRESTVARPVPDPTNPENPKMSDDCLRISIMTFGESLGVPVGPIEAEPTHLRSLLSPCVRHTWLVPTRTHRGSKGLNMGAVTSNCAITL